jgi:hypothetical protein
VGTREGGSTLKRVITLKHGGGGMLMIQLLDGTIVPAYVWTKFEISRRRSLSIDIGDVL